MSRNYNDDYGYGQYDPYVPNNQQQQGNYSQGGYESQSNYEMSPMPTQGGQGYGPNTILDQCRDVDEGVASVENYIKQINGLYRRLLSDVDPARENALRAEADELAEKIKLLYRNLIERMKTIKKMPDAGNARNTPQIDRVQRRLNQAVESYQKVQVSFRQDSEAQMARQYRIVRPDATEAEVREAVQDTSNQQIFSQALIQSDRRGDAQKVSQMVRARHEEIQKIERDFVELAEMFRDLEALVVQQEPAVTQIEQRGEEVREDMVKANDQMGEAIVKARSRNRKKWWCLGISVGIIVIIVVIVVVVVLVNKK